MSHGKAVLSAAGCKGPSTRPHYVPAMPRRTVSRRQSAGSSTASLSVLHQSKAQERGRGEAALGANKFGATPLMIASWSDNTMEIRRLLEEESVYLDATDTIGRTALMMAAGEGRLAAVRLLVELGADIFRTDDFGESALSMAAREGHVNTCRLLLEHDADLNEPDQFGQTPLIKASMNGHAEAVQLLLEKGAVHSLADASQETALMKAVKRGHPNVVRLLGDFGAMAQVRGKGTRSAVTHPTSPPITPLRRPRAESMTTNSCSACSLIGSQALFQSGGRSRVSMLNQPITKPDQQLLASKEQLEARLQRRQTQIATLKDLSSQSTKSNNFALKDDAGIAPKIKKMSADCNGPMEPNKLRSIKSTPLGVREYDVAQAISELPLDDPEQSPRAKNGAMGLAKPVCDLQPLGREKKRECLSKLLQFDRLHGGTNPTGVDGQEQPGSTPTNDCELDGGCFSPCTLDWLDEADTLPRDTVPEMERDDPRVLSIFGSKLFKRVGLARTTADLSRNSQIDQPIKMSTNGSKRLSADSDANDELARLREIIALATANQEQVQKERIALQEEREALRRERAALQQEREHWQRAKQALDIVQRNFTAWPWMGLSVSRDPSLSLSLSLPQSYVMRQAPPEYTESCLTPADQSMDKDNK